MRTIHRHTVQLAERAGLDPRHEADQLVEAGQGQFPVHLQSGRVGRGAGEAGERAERLARGRLTGAAPYSAGLQVDRELTLAGLDQLVAFVSRIESAALAELRGVSPDRAHQVPAGAVVAAATMRALDVPCVRICPWALREGVILRRLDSLGGS